MCFFSLVVSTKGRSSELGILLQSLAAQSCVDFEVIVVDQNPDDRLRAYVNQAWPFVLKFYRHEGASGASLGRNHGVRLARGEFLLFPDDDCWYPSQFLLAARAKLNQREMDVLSGRAADLRGRSINGRFDTSAKEITARDVWTTSIEWVMFVRRSMFERLGGFDGDIGVGALTPWQSCEAQDLILRAIKAGAACEYDPSLFGHHVELNIVQPDEAQIAKGRAYARGLGFVLRKHRALWIIRLYWIARPALASMLRLAQRNRAAARYFLQVALGRLEGAIGKKISKPWAS